MPVPNCDRQHHDYDEKKQWPVDELQFKSLPYWLQEKLGEVATLLKPITSTCDHQRVVQCGDPFKEDDLVVLNGTKEEVEKLQKAMEERRSKAKTAKKSKKSKDTKVSKKQDSAAESCDLPQNTSETESTSLNGDGSSETAPGPSTSGECSKALKAPVGPVAGSKRSIQDMRDKSETYKSLFTSHSSAKRTKDQISNWVTHTPYHF